MEVINEAAEETRASRLTPRQLDVLRLAADGRTAKTIASALYISPRTVNWHLEEIFRSLGVKNRTQAVYVATREGML